MGRLFGTDGVRGLANAGALTGEMAFRIAQHGTRQLLKNHKKDRRPIYVGRDTRVSGEMLEAAVAAGIASVGVEARLLGVLPTPAVAYLTRELGGLGGIMISASHNPFGDNGIKLFGADGYKIPDSVEDAIETQVKAGASSELPTGEAIGRIGRDPEAVQSWLRHLAHLLPDEHQNRKIKLAIDCANGSLAPWAPAFFGGLGFRLDAIGTTPDGININAGVGSTHMGALINMMRKEHFDIGFAFDGDADRVIAVSERGDVIDGDFILAIAGRYLKERDRLMGNAVVTTVMANLGLDLALKNLDIKVHKTRVGDRFVLEEMNRQKSVIGGEQSGHIILSEYATTGDGLLTACFLLKVIQETGMPIGELAAVMTKLPQVLVNIKVKEKNFENIPAIKDSIRHYEELLDGRGRLLVRSSGTEPMVRVMAEGPDEKEIRMIVDKLAKVISTHCC